MMAGYNDLISRIGKLKENVAVFRKVVLHCHSFQSRDGKTTEQEFQDCMKDSSIDLIAITDHMRCGFACDFSNSKYPSDKCVLPGIEINLRPPSPWKFRLHVLVIFPEKYSIEQIWKIMPPSIPAEKTCTGQEEINIELSDFVKIIHDN